MRSRFDPIFALAHLAQRAWLVLMVVCIGVCAAGAQTPPTPSESPPAAPDEPTAAEVAFSKARDRAIRRSPHRKLLAQLYRESAGGPLFFSEGQPTQAARDLVAGVAALEAHALNRGAYRLGHSHSSFQSKAPEAKRTRKKRKKAKAKPAFEPTATQDPKDLAKQDVRLAHALVQYIMDFRVVRQAHPFRPTVNMGRARARHGEMVVKTAQQLLEQPSLNLKSLWPTSPSYQALLDARVRYLELQAQRKARTLEAPRLSWVKWKKAKRKNKLTGKIVIKLQKRLAAEGFYAGELHGEFDIPTAEALKSARVAHGLPADGEVDYHFVKRANRSFSDKLDAIQVSLQRARESVPLRRGLSTYVRVNIPAFELELVEDGKVTRRHRVIVGNNKLDYNRHDWKQGFLNRTPLLETRMMEVIVNPTWRPPPRIRDEEFDGQENVVVGPGPRNPLGYVKFTLDRTNAVFMHDTNKRKKFGKIVRAFSHGCIRVHDAMSLAEHIATRYTQVDPPTFTSAREGQSTFPMPLRRELPVFVEYQTVDVDAAGKLRFHPDIYRYDRAWLRGRSPKRVVRYGSPALRPKAVPVISFDDYKRLKSEGGKAPTEWPVGGQAPPADG